MQHPDEGTIHAWLDDALDPTERAAVESHVAECETCAAVAAEARGLIAASSRVLVALDQVPPDVLPAGTVATPMKGRPRQWWNSSVVRVAIAASFLVAVTSVLVTGRGDKVEMATADLRRVPAEPYVDNVRSVTAPAASVPPAVAPKSEAAMPPQVRGGTAAASSVIGAPSQRAEGGAAIAAASPPPKGQQIQMPQSQVQQSTPANAPLPLPPAGAVAGSAVGASVQRALADAARRDTATDSARARMAAQRVASIDSLSAAKAAETAARQRAESLAARQAVASDARVRVDSNAMTIASAGGGAAAAGRAGAGGAAGGAGGVARGGGGGGGGGRGGAAGGGGRGGRGGGGATAVAAFLGLPASGVPCFALTGTLPDGLAIGRADSAVRVPSRFALRTDTVPDGSTRARVYMVDSTGVIARGVPVPGLSWSSNPLGYRVAAGNDTTRILVISGRGGSPFASLRGISTPIQPIPCRP